MAGVVGSKLLFPDGTIQHAGVAIVRDPYLPAELSPCHIGYQREDSLEYSRTRECLAVTAACCMIERWLFAEVGGFDEGYWNGFEDIDLCFKVHEAGYRIVYQPASVVIHHESKSGLERKKWKWVICSVYRSGGPAKYPLNTYGSAQRRWCGSVESRMRWFRPTGGKGS